MHKLLVLTNEQTLGEFFKLALTRAGYSVLTARTQESAAEIMKVAKCHVFYIDGGLPLGYTFCQKIRSEYPESSVCIVMGYLPESDQTMWQQSGISNFYIKLIKMKSQPQSVPESPQVAKHNAAH
jgi:DNA-binding response OmpR family regulator